MGKLILAVLPAVIMASLALLVPVPESGIPEGVSVQEFRGTLFGTVLFALLYIGAAILFWLGLGAFKERLRRAYKAICIGLVLISIAMLQIPGFLAFGAYESAWVQAGLIPVPYAIAVYALYRGTRSFATALDDTSIWIRQRVVVPVILASTAASFVVLYALRPLGTAVEGCVGVWATMFFIVTIIVALRIRRVAGPEYTTALSWFIAALISTTVALALPVIVLMMGGGRAAFLAIPPAIAASLSVAAGYKFNTIGASSSFKPGRSALDVVVYVASLASDPRAIDPTLDAVRSISARLAPGEPLSMESQMVLARVYQELEEYLLTKEALRAFDAQTLHRKIDAKFSIHLPGEETFWNNIKGIKGV